MSTVTRQRSVSSPAGKISAQSLKARPRSVTAFTSIPEEDDDEGQTVSKPPSATPLRRASVGSTGTISRRPSGSGLTSVPVANIKPISTSSSRTSTPVAAVSARPRSTSLSSSSVNPRPLPRPSSTLQKPIAKRPNQQQSQQQMPAEDDPVENVETKQKNDSIVQAYESAIRSSVFKQAIDALQEMQSSLLMSSYQAVLWEADAREMERMVRKMKTQKAATLKAKKLKDQSTKDTVELLNCKLRESIKGLQST